MVGDVSRGKYDAVFRSFGFAAARHFHKAFASSSMSISSACCIRCEPCCPWGPFFFFLAYSLCDLDMKPWYNCSSCITIQIC